MLWGVDTGSSLRMLVAISVQTHALVHVLRSSRALREEGGAQIVPWLVLISNVATRSAILVVLEQSARRVLARPSQTEASEQLDCMSQMGCAPKLLGSCFTSIPTAFESWVVVKIGSLDLTRDAIDAFQQYHEPQSLLTMCKDSY